MLANGFVERKQMNHYSKKNRLRAFTLIELLVVIAIIALLLSILMPSLQKVKEVAASVICRAHMRGAGVGMQIYVNDNSGWLAGPNTSGKFCNDTRPATPPNGVTSPVQNMDWISPTMGDDLGLSQNGNKRLVQILNSKLKCPSNKMKYPLVYEGGSYSDVQDWLNSRGLAEDKMYYSSYSAALGFHTWDGADAYQTTGVVNLPTKYRPKLSNVGLPYNKVYIMDGARYVNNDGTPTQATFNAMTYQDDGGNFMLYGPSVSLKGDPFYRLAQEVLDPGFSDLSDAATRSDIYLDYAFRHDQSLQVLFFDGHSEKLKWQDAIKTSYYFPPDSTIVNAAGTADPYDVNGKIK